MKLLDGIVAEKNRSASVPNRLCCPRLAFTRREFGLLVAAGAATWLLPGCGGGSASSGPINGVPGRSDVYDGPTLSPGFDLGVNTSGGMTNWVTLDAQGFMTCAYPAGQQWGAIFITAGKVEPATSQRTVDDYSSYNFLALDLKGAAGGEQVSVGVKTESDPDNGQEPLFIASNLTTSWQTFKIPFSSLAAGSSYPTSRFSHLYIVCELVFTTSASETISFRNVQYQK